MDIVKPFTFLTEDERWLEKLGIGVAVILISMLLSVVLIGVVGFFIIMGYSIRLLQNVRDGVAKPLPNWDRWGDDLFDGFKLMVASMLYALPIMILTIPVVIGAAIAESSSSGESVGFLLLACGTCLTLLYALFLSVAQPGIVISFARDKTIGSALRFGDIWEWTRRNIGPVIIAALVYLAASAVIPFAALLVGALLCIVGLVVTLPLSTLVLSLVQAHLYGQLAYADPMGGYRQAPPTPPAGSSSTVKVVSSADTSGSGESPSAEQVIRLGDTPTSQGDAGSSTQRPSGQDERPNQPGNGGWNI